MWLKALVCVAFFFHNANTQIAIYNLNLEDLYKMQTGIGWPHILNVFEGHEAQLKLASTLENQMSCHVTTPNGVSFDVHHPPNNRYESWTDECGLRVKNVTPTDEGRWRLTAVNAEHSITGWTEIHIEASINEYTASPIILHDGEPHPNLALSTLDSSYCLVQQPFSDRTLVPGQCSMSLDRATRAVQGNWHLLIGLPGRVTELAADRSVTVESKCLSFSGLQVLDHVVVWSNTSCPRPLCRSITVETERLETGFIHGNNKLHLYCNLHYSERNITFCRFQRTNGQSGYNIIDGLSDGEHSYYGEGFARRQCGMTVENPTAGDYVSWRCTVGVQERVGTVIEQQVPLQALIRVTGVPGRLRRKSRSHEPTIFVQTGMTTTVSCEADATLSYCWFQHPNGSHFTPVPLIDDNQLFWYTGESLSVGDCGITFTHVTELDDGVWTCHMGPRDSMGVEITDTVNLRVTGPLAAREKEVQAMIGGNTTLYCHSSNGNRPLDYCRFLSPSSVGISIDETVTANNAILNRFYFTSNRALDYGDCSLTIDPVMEEDDGVWTCAAVVDEETLESSDTIRVRTTAPQQRSIAGILGLAIGASVMFLVFGGVMVYKYGRLPSLTVPWRRTNNTDADTVSFDRSRNAGSLTSFNSNADAQTETTERIPDSNLSGHVRVSLSAVSSDSNSSDETNEPQITQSVPNMIDLNQAV